MADFKAYGEISQGADYKVAKFKDLSNYTDNTSGVSSSTFPSKTVSFFKASTGAQIGMTQNLDSNGEALATLTEDLVLKAILTLTPVTGTPLRYTTYYQADERLRGLYAKKVTGKCSCKKGTTGACSDANDGAKLNIVVDTLIRKAAFDSAQDILDDMYNRYTKKNCDCK